MRVHRKLSMAILVLLLSLPWQVAQALETVKVNLGSNQMPTTFVVGGTASIPVSSYRQYQPKPVPIRVKAVAPIQVKQVKPIQKKLKPAVVKSIPPYWFRVVEPATVVAVEPERPVITHAEQPISPPTPIQPIAQRQWWGATMAPKVPSKFAGTIPATRHPSARMDEVITNVPPMQVHKPVSTGKNCYCPCAKHVTRLSPIDEHPGSARFIVTTPPQRGYKAPQQEPQVLLKDVAPTGSRSNRFVVR